VSFENCDKYVIKIGPAEEIENEYRNFQTFAGHTIYDKLQCPYNNALDSSFQTHMSRFCLPHPLKTIAYQFRGYIPSHSENPPLSFQDLAAEYMRGGCAHFTDYLIKINSFLREFARPADIILPDHLVPNWKRVAPLLSTAESMSHSAIKYGEIKRCWDRWAKERAFPLKVDFGPIHGNLRCANIVVTQNEAHLIDFGSMIRAPSFLNLIRLEIDIIFRSRIDTMEQRELLEGVFDPKLWDLRRARPASRPRCLVRDFRELYIDNTKSRNPYILARNDLYLAYLCELLRRTTYWEEEFLESSSRMLLWWLMTMSVDQLNNIRKAPSPPARDLERYGQILRPAIPEQIGLRKCFYGANDNEIRNKDKRLAIEQSRGVILLLAHSGQSYLSHLGCHYTSICAYLEQQECNRFLAIILNPFSIPAVQMYLNEIHALKSRGYDITKVAPQVVQHLEEDRVKLYESVVSYRNSKKRYGEQIHVRFTSFEPGCTILWTSTYCFVEPYFQTDPGLRAKHKLNTYKFELSVSNECAQGLFSDMKRSTTHVNFFLEYSISFEEWVARQVELREAANRALEVLVFIGEVEQIESDCIKEYMRKVSWSP